MKKWINKNILHSIKGKYTTYMVLGVLLASAFVGGSSALLMHKSVETHTVSIMNLNCNQVATSLNPAFEGTKQSVQIMKRFADDLDYDFKDLRSDPQIMDAYTEDVYRHFSKIADCTAEAATFYFRHNPDYFSSKGGFLYSRQYDQQTFRNGFVELEITDLSKFDRDDPMVEWMYRPIDQRKGGWISPYWGDNLKMNMVSYVEPIIISGKIIGIIGMDINFDQLTSRLREVTVYKGSYALLTDKDGKVLSTAVKDRSRAIGSGREEVAIFRDLIKPPESKNCVIHYKYRGESKQMAYVTLNNGMKLIMVADTSEIFRERNILIVITFISSLGVAVILAMLGFQFAKRMTYPLEELSDIAISVGTGNLNAEIPSQDRQDEIGNLARAFNNTVAHIKLYVDYFQNLAYKDGLTGAQNKAAYDMAAEQADVEIRMNKGEFAIVMIDLNRLKKINDTYGHECGNTYIRNLYNVIKEFFDKDSIYRIGGDEFLVFLRGEEYASRDEKFRGLQEVLRKEPAEGFDPWDNVSAASGMAVFDPGMDDSAATVFERADEEMYKNKVDMKAVRTD